jgi:hypothetical protein
MYDCLPYLFVLTTGKEWKRMWKLLGFLCPCGACGG